MKTSFIPNLYRLYRYNLKIIFGNRFLYFILSAVGFYIVAVILSLFSEEEITMATGYNMLLVPSFLLIFYPACFGIQNDQDAKITEIIFGIPDYRYKIWLFRLVTACLVCFTVTLILAVITDRIVVEAPPFQLSAQVMVPTLFIGMLSFMLSTIIRNGNGTAVCIIVIGILLFSVNDMLGVSRWNLFLNPFDIPLNRNPEIFYNILSENRTILLIVSAVFLLTGLQHTQNREKFI